MNRVVIVGASLAGTRAAMALRSGGFSGDITLVGAEPHQPYDRPPLSKKVLAGEWEPDRIALVRPDDWENLRLDTRLGVAAASLSLAARVVILEDGTVVPFDGLVIATGAALRRLPGQIDHPGIFELRSLDDALSLRDALKPGDRRVTVIGAGFIGLEVAATARQLGNTVTVVEGLPSPLIRGLGAEMGIAVTGIHDDHGVVLHCGVTVESIRPGGDVDEQGESVGNGALDVHVVHGDGTAAVLASDVVVVGIGVSPATGWLEGSGLQLRDGVVCDATLNALDVNGEPIAGVYAAGDVVRWPNEQFGGEEMRIEHWTNASEQALAAAANLLATAAGGPATTFSTVPFFWSEQYGKRIQFLGRAAGDDEVRVVKGSVEARSFLALYGKDGQFRGALGMAMPKPLMQCRTLLLQHLTFEQAIVAVAALV